MTIKRLLTISRPIFYLPSLTVFVGGFVYAGNSFNVPVAISALIMTFPICLVIFGINDIADMESDAKNARKGSVDGAVVTKKEVRPLVTAMVIITAISLLVVLIWCTVGVLAMTALLFALGYMYSAPPFRLKVVPIADSVVNGLGVVSIFLAGYWASSASLVIPNTAILAAIFLFSAAVHAFGALQDFDADKQAGDGTIAVKFGTIATTVFSIIGFTVSALLLWGGKTVSIQKSVVLAYIAVCIAGAMYALFDTRPKVLRKIFFAYILLVPLVMVVIVTLRLFG